MKQKYRRKLAFDHWTKCHERHDFVCTIAPVGSFVKNNFIFIYLFLFLFIDNYICNLCTKRKYTTDSISVIRRHIRRKLCIKQKSRKPTSTKSINENSTMSFEIVSPNITEKKKIRGCYYLQIGKIWYCI
jgi:hypothetical protein